MIEKATHVKGGALMLRRIGLALLAVVLCVGLAPTLSWADESDSDDENASVAAVDENAEESAQEVADSETEAAEDENSEGAGIATYAAAESTYDAKAAAALLDNLMERFSKDGDDYSITDNTVYAAIALDQLGCGSDIDKDAVLRNLAEYEEINDHALTAEVIAKYIFILMATGEDCTKVEIDGVERNLITEMEELTKPDSIDVYSAVWILAAYQYGDYEQGEACEVSKEELVDLILKSRDEAGLFGTEDEYNVFTTALAIYALIPYMDSEGVEEAIVKAVEAVRAMQNEDGGFGYSSEYSESSLNATAAMVFALSALDYDVSTGTEFVTESGWTPVSYLVANADEDLKGYTQSELADETLTSSLVFLALASVGELEEEEEVVDGVTESGDLLSYFTWPSSTASTGSSGTSGTSGLTSSSTSRTIAQTGDETIIAATVVGVVAVAAIALIIVALFRMRKLRRD